MSDAAPKIEEVIEEAAPPNALMLKLAAAKTLWNPPQETFLVRFFLLVAVCSAGGAVGASYLFWRHLHPVSAEAVLEIAEAKEREAEKVKGKDEKSPEKATLGGSPFPKEMLRNKKGQMESGHDLIEPEIESTRQLASLLKSDLKVSVGARFIEIPQIVVSPRSGARNDGTLEIDIALEADSPELHDEVEKRKTEIKALIGNLGSARQRDELKTVKGMLKLKEDTQRELNLLLAKGKVTDVLFLNYNLH